MLVFRGCRLKGFHWVLVFISCHWHQVISLLLADSSSEEFWRLVDEILLPDAVEICFSKAVLPTETRKNTCLFCSWFGLFFQGSKPLKIIRIDICTFEYTYWFLLYIHILSMYSICIFLNTHKFASRVNTPILLSHLSLSLNCVGIQGGWYSCFCAVSPACLDGSDSLSGGFWGMGPLWLGGFWR